MLVISTSLTTLQEPASTLSTMTSGAVSAMACTIFPARAGSSLVTVMDMIWVEPTPSTETQASS